MSYPSKCRDYCFTTKTTQDEKWECINELKCNNIKKSVCSKYCLEQAEDKNNWKEITDCYVESNCDEYESDVCEQKSNYKKYVAEKCGPIGWSNSGRSDCWLDAVLYALFGSTTLSTVFNKILEDLATSTKVTEQKMAASISNYLYGMNDPLWEDDCKRKFKNKIISDIEHYLKYWLKDKKDKHFYDYPGWKLSYVPGEKDGNSNGIVRRQDYNVYSGNVYIMLKLFQHFSEDIYLWNVTNTLHFTAGANSIKNHIKSIFDESYDIIKNEKVFIYHMNSITVSSGDLTRRSTISKFKNYTLQAILIGLASHNMSYIRCYASDSSSKFLKYDDNHTVGEQTVQNDDIKVLDEFGVEQDTFGFTGLTSISFIYVRDDVEKVLYGGERNKLEEFKKMYLQKVPNANNKELNREYGEYKLEYERMYGGF